MGTIDAFPLHFTSSRCISGGGKRGYVVGAFFTPGFTPKARRLAASCEAFGVPYVLHEVPAVHRSIYALGTGDASFTKPNFIHHLLAEHGKPVLYVDADCEFMAPPYLLDHLVETQCSFSVYNWLADEHTDAFAPIELNLTGRQPIKNRFYAFTHSVDHYSQDQLLCSGLVQFYGNSQASRVLLNEWQKTILAFPGCSDDACLDFAFNNLGPRGYGLKLRWLPKSYARISWWIYAEPVINNVHTPNDENIFVPIKDSVARQRFYFDRMTKRTEVRLFPRDCIIDTQERTICRVDGDTLVLVSPTDQHFWL
jgi:nucleotide-diphospho-sugar transferase